MFAGALPLLALDGCACAAVGCSAFIAGGATREWFPRDVLYGPHGGALEGERFRDHASDMAVMLDGDLGPPPGRALALPTRMRVPRNELGLLAARVLAPPAGGPLG